MGLDFLVLGGRMVITESTQRLLALGPFKKPHRLKEKGLLQGSSLLPNIGEPACRSHEKDNPGLSPTGNCPSLKIPCWDAAGGSSMCAEASTDALLPGRPVQQTWAISPKPTVIASDKSRVNMKSLNAFANSCSLFIDTRPSGDFSTHEAGLDGSSPPVTVLLSILG